MATPAPAKGGGGGARLAVFSISRSTFSDVRRWIAAAGHDLPLVVTKPTAAGLEVAEAAGETVVVLSPQVAKARALVTELGIDLCVVAAFSRIPENLTAVSPCGFVNLHPTLLPEYPGPNPYRAIFDGAPAVGFTLHRITPELDGGPILAQAGFEVPSGVTPDLLAARWSAALVSVLDEGIPRALAGEPGTAQPEGSGSFARPFSDAETELDWELPVEVLERQATALLMAGVQPLGRIDGALVPVRRLRALPGLEARRRGPITSSSRRAVVGVGDGVVELDLGELPR